MIRPNAIGNNGDDVLRNEREERVREERRRYTAQLRRRAQEQVTAELGAESSAGDVDRQVAMLIQHALETTGARYVSLLRPIPRGERWHVTTVFEDGDYYYGLIAPSQLLFPMIAAQQKRPVLLARDRARDPALPRLEALGIRSYLGVPVISDDVVVAVIEAVDVARPDELDPYATALEQAALTLAESLAAESQRYGARTPSVPAHGLDESAVLDLVLRPPIEADESFEIAPQEWALLNHLDGERSLGVAAAAAGLSLSAAVSIAASLLERGLIRIGREERRRL